MKTRGKNEPIEKHSRKTGKEKERKLKYLYFFYEIKFYSVS
jgi:hypothetical protein